VSLEALQQCRAILSADERERSERFAFEALRREYVVAHALLRSELSNGQPVAPSDWRFVTNRHGRPEVAAPTGAAHLGFNLSHTSGLVACAIALRRSLGIDVEEVTRAARAIDIIDRFFTPAEAADLRGLAGRERERRFALYWTLKEAYLKARGDGLSQSPQLVAFRLSPNGAVSVHFDSLLRDDPRRWQFAWYDIADTHVLALCVERIGEDALRITCRAGTPRGGQFPARSGAHRQED
jgi:4'-phosphopantetheinyl transferase